MSLNMIGHIDQVFKSVAATRTVKTSGSYVNGIWTDSGQRTTSHTVNIQPASDREIDFLSQGGERLVDVRRVYVNDGDMQSIDVTGEWTFLGQKFKTVKCDNRYWRNYCKLIVTRIDDQ